VSSHALQRETASAGTLFRAVLFCGAMLIFWITLDPLKDLSTGDMLDPTERSDLANQIIYLTMFAICIATLLHSGWRRISPLLHPAYGLTLAWFLLSSMMSPNAGISIRRLVLTVMVMTIVGILLLLPRDRHQFESWIGGVALTVVALCFLAVIAVPHLAIHQTDAALEVNLAGSWRGIYDHKSRAGPMMVLFIIIGTYLVGRRRLALGLPLLIGSTVFLAFTGAKQPQAIVLFVLAWSWLASRIRSKIALLFFCLGPLTLYLAFTVGSILFPFVASFNQAVMSDPTFTNRTGIWTFAYEHAAQRPIFGWGLHAFWNTGLVRYQDPTNPAAWAANAAHSHDSYLDLALSTGLPGLAISCIAILVLPVLDFARAKEVPDNRATALLFFRIWMFGVFLGSMETVFFQRDEAFWVAFLTAIFGLRYMTTFPVKA